MARAFRNSRLSPLGSYLCTEAELSGSVHFRVEGVATGVFVFLNNRGLFVSYCSMCFIVAGDRCVSIVLCWVSV